MVVSLTVKLGLYYIKKNCTGYWLLFWKRRIKWVLNITISNLQLCRERINLLCKVLAQRHFSLLQRFFMIGLVFIITLSSGIRIWSISLKAVWEIIFLSSFSKEIYCVGFCLSIYLFIFRKFKPLIVLDSFNNCPS